MQPRFLHGMRFSGTAQVNSCSKFADSLELERYHAFTFESLSRRCGSEDRPGLTVVSVRPKTPVCLESARREICPCLII